jgi:hypothetical protein
MTTLLPFLLGWIVLLVAVVVLYVCRKRVAREDDETLHVLDSDAGKVPQQAVVAKKLDALDRWVKILTILLVVYGLALAGLCVYASWEASSRVPVG